MCDRQKQAWAAVFISNALIHTVVIANPIYVPQCQSGKQVETDWSSSFLKNWLIQSSTTEKSPPSQESTTEPVAESTIQSLTSAKPITESTAIPEITKKPMTTTLPTIADVTIDMELPVPMETLNMSDYKQVCGRRLFPEPRFVGDNLSFFGKRPWKITLLRQWLSETFQPTCSAVLLNENWAITAAHCVDDVPPASDLVLRFGEHDPANEDKLYEYQERKVQIVAIHPLYRNSSFEYDLALLRFYEPFLPFQPNVLPICLPDDDDFVGRTAYVTGWSILYDKGPSPFVLQEVAVPIINNTVCEAMYRNAGYFPHKIPHSFICAGWKNGGHDACVGNSGSPMVIQRVRDKRWVLAGIVSWANHCATPNRPGVYMRISEFRKWIKDEIVKIRL